MPATALAAISASIEGAIPQHMVPAPIGSVQTLALLELHGSRVRPTEECQAQ